MWGTLLGSLVKPVADIIDKAVPDKDLAEQLKHQTGMAIMQQGAAELEAKKAVILAEAGGTGLKANWRPITMLTFVFIVANNYIIAPYVGLFLPEYSLTLELPPDLWALIKIGLGGYTVGRSAEKVAASLKA